MNTLFEQSWHARYRQILGPEQGDKAFEAARQVGLQTATPTSEAFQVYVDFLLRNQPPLDDLLNHALVAAAFGHSFEWIMTHPQRAALVALWLAQKDGPALPNQ